MKNILLNRLSKELKLSGFKKINYTWVQERDNLFYIFNIQPSKYENKGQEEDFAINIGIYSSEVNNLCWANGILSNKIKETDCCLRGRLSLFFNANKDWFTIKNENDIEKIKYEVDNLINVDVIPFFQKISSYNDLYDVMIKVENRVIQKELHQIYIACIEFLMGEKDNALNRLLSIENTAWEDKAKIIVDKMTKSI